MLKSDAHFRPCLEKGVCVTNRDRNYIVGGGTDDTCLYVFYCATWPGRSIEIVKLRWKCNIDVAILVQLVRCNKVDGVVSDCIKLVGIWDHSYLRELAFINVEHRKTLHYLVDVVRLRR